MIRCWLHFTHADVRASVETGQSSKDSWWPFLHCGNKRGFLLLPFQRQPTNCFLISVQMRLDMKAGELTIQSWPRSVSMEARLKSTRRLISPSAGSCDTCRISQDRFWFCWCVGNVSPPTTARRAPQVTAGPRCLPGPCCLFPAPVEHSFLLGDTFVFPFDHVVFLELFLSNKEGGGVSEVM